MNSKKIWRIAILSAVTVLLMTCLIIGFTACGDQNSNNNENPPTPTCQHTFDEWKTVTPATCTADGQKSRNCTKCGTSETETVQKSHYLINNVCGICGYNSATSQPGEIDQQLSEVLDKFMGVITANFTEEELCYILLRITINTEYQDALGAICIEYEVLLPYIGYDEIPMMVAYIFPDEQSASAYVKSHDFLYTYQEKNLVVEQSKENLYQSAIAPELCETSKSAIAFCKSKLSYAKKNAMSYGCAIRMQNNLTVNMLYGRLSNTDSHYNKISCDNTYFAYINNGNGTQDFKKILLYLTFGNSIQAKPMENFTDDSFIKTDGDCYMYLKDKPGLHYALSRDKKKYYVIEYNNSNYDTEVVIPSTHNGLPVTAIWNQAFSGHSELTSITVPDSVTYIGTQAFYDCEGLKEITLGTGIKAIAHGAFDSCVNLEKVCISDFSQWCNINFVNPYDYDDSAYPYYISNPMYFAQKLYLNGKPIGDGFEIPADVTGIPDYTFKNCTELTTITIPNNVTRIGQGAFADCANLTSITIGENVTEIGETAFGNCENLDKVYISDFTSWCTIDFKNNHYTNISDGFRQLSNPMYYAQSLFLNGAPITENFSIPAGVTEIPSYTFKNCTELTGINIPDSVKKIKDKAFINCNKLEKVCVSDLANWCAISFDNYNDYYGPYNDEGYSNPMYYAQRLYINGAPISDTFTIPDGIITIPDYTFKNCTDLADLIIPLSIKYINRNAFDNYNNHIAHVFYKGSSKDWSEIYFANRFSSEKVYFYSETEPVAYGNFWHYVSDVPTVWKMNDQIPNVFEAINKILNITENKITFWSAPYSENNDFVFYISTNDTAAYMFADEDSAAASLNSVKEEFSNYTYVYQSANLIIGENTEGTYANAYTTPSISYSSESALEFLKTEIANAIQTKKQIYGDITLSIPDYQLSSILQIAGECYYEDETYGYYYDKVYFGYASSSNSSASDTVDELLADKPLWNYTEDSYINKDNGEIYVHLKEKRGFHFKRDGAELAIVGYNNGGENSTVLTIPTTCLAPDTLLELPVTSISDTSFYAFNDAFRRHGEITAIAIPTTITAIAPVFWGCDGLQSIYYHGTASNWNDVNLNWNSGNTSSSDMNDEFTKATVYFYSDSEPTLNDDGAAYDGNFWHYVDNVPTVWTKQN